MPFRGSQQSGNSRHDHVQNASYDLSRLQQQEQQQQQQSAYPATSHFLSSTSSSSSSSNIASTSSLTHALDMQRIRKPSFQASSSDEGSLMPEGEHYYGTADSRGGAGGGGRGGLASDDGSRGSSRGDVWLSSSHQPVSEQELNDLLASSQWKPGELEMDESLEELLSSSFSSSSWQPTPTVSTTQGGSMWTGFREQSSSNNLAAVPSSGDMEWDSLESRSPMFSEPSLSPSSFSAPFPPGITDAELLRALNGDRNSIGSPAIRSLSISGEVPTSSSGGSSLVNHSTYTSPQSRIELMSSPEDNLSRSHLQYHHHHHHQQQQHPDHHIYTPSPAISQSSQHSLQDSYQSGLQHISPPPGNRRRRSIRRTNTTSSSSISSTRSGSIGGAGMSTSGSHGSLSSIGIRSRAGTLASISSYPRALDHKSSLPSSSSTGTMGRIQENPPSELQAIAGISTSLSAELAGLGLDVSDLYPASALQSHDVTMGDFSAEMQRTTSSSSSSTNRTRRLNEHGDNSFLSQATSSLESSGIDDSLLSTGSNNNQSSTRWIHGKDTPPSSPAPSFGSRLRPSPLLEQRAGGGISTALQSSSGSPHSRPDEFGVRKGKQPAGSTDWSRTWPRTTSQTDSSGLSSTSSPMHHSRSDNIGNPGLSPPVDTRARRPTSASSTQSLQERRLKQRNSRGYASGGGIPFESPTIGIGSSSRKSNDSLRSDIGPSRSTKMSAEAIEQRRWKRMSASFSLDQKSKQRHQEDQHQYDQVSDALDTLRRFLRQRESGTGVSSTHSSRPSSYAGGSGGSSSGVASLGEQISTLLATSNSTSQITAPQQRKLRHPPPGPLPPRGSVFASPSDSPTIPQGPNQEGIIGSVEAGRLAALENLAKRVRKMKDESQRFLDDL